MSADEAPPIEATEETSDGTRRVVRVSISTLVWALSVLAAVAVLAAFFFVWYLPGRHTNQAAERSAVAAAKDGVVAVYTYSADTLDRDISSAQSHLTGDFLSQYKQYAQSSATTVTKQNAVKTSASVVGAALLDMHPASAEVLLFLNQITTTSANPAQQMASRSVEATLTKVDGKWLISSLKPV